MAQIDYLLSRRQASAALAVAQEALAALPDYPLLLAALGRAQIASGDLQQAVSTFKKVTSMQPTLPEPIMIRPSLKFVSSTCRVKSREAEQNNQLASLRSPAHSASFGNCV